MITKDRVFLHPQKAPAEAASIACPRCGVIDQPALGPGSGPHHASARCRHCGAFWRWVSQYASAVRQARREQAREVALAQRPPSQAQLAYLRALGCSAPMSSMLFASDMISGLLGQRRQEVQR